MGQCFAKFSDNVMLKKLQAIVNDPDTLQKPLDFAFKHFDKDGSGYIEGSEILRVVEKVSRICGLAKAPTPAINLVFDKVAGPDGRLDREEFRTLLQRMFKLAEEQAKEALELAKKTAKTAVGASTSEGAATTATPAA